MKKVRSGKLTSAALKSYCEDHGIMVPTGSTIATYEAAIARAGLHLQDIKMDDEIGCFGFWADQDMVCATCDFESLCKLASLGTSFEKYEKMTDKIAFTDSLRKKKSKR